MKNRPTTSTIIDMLESGEFSTLQTLMLKNNIEKNAFFSYDLVTPNYKGDTWKAFFFIEAQDITRNTKTE